MRIDVVGIDLGKNLCSLTGLDETGADANRFRAARTGAAGATLPRSEFSGRYVKRKVFPS